LYEPHCVLHHFFRASYWSYCLSAMASYEPSPVGHAHQSLLRVELKPHSLFPL
jgi:hypothetical protein